MNRRSLFGKLGAVAAVVAVGSQVEVAQAAPACAECEQIRAKPPVVPDAFEMSPELAEPILELTHAMAIRERISHQAAGTLLYQQWMPAWAVVPEPGSLTVNSNLSVTDNLKIEPMQIVAMPGMATSALGGTVRGQMQQGPLQRDGNPALSSLLTSLENMGYIFESKPDA